MTNLPHYYQLLLELQKQIPPGEVWSVSVIHADDCSHFLGGDCDCAPEMILVPSDKELSLQDLEA